MGLFDLFKKKAEEPQAEPIGKQYDYFAFKVHGVADQESQKVLESVGVALHEQPNFVSVAIKDDELIVSVNGKAIGKGDAQAKNKFVENCSKNYNIHSLSVYGGDDGKNYGCKVRIKYFY